MASYTDKAPTFNPYIQQQPVEAMVKVGMYKQQKYDEGVQKIQESFNKIAGLDILKDVDRSYLKSELSKTTSKLRGYASGDFSNSQLTNSVTGMVNKLSKDENIRNSVFATQKVRKEMMTAGAAEKAGESSVVNQWALDSEIQKWMNDGEVGSSFTGKYTPYTDVDKKLADVYSKMSEEEKVIENPYMVDAKGETMFFDKKNKRTTEEAGGQPRVNEVMYQTSITGKSSNKIMKNFMSSLSPDDIAQLQLNGRYHYKDSDAETFKAQLKGHAETLKKTYAKSILDISKEIETNPDLTEVQKQAYISHMTKFQAELDDGTIDKKLEEQLKVLDNPDAVESYKGSIYMESYLNEKAEAMSNESRKDLIKTNPLWQARFKTKEFNFKISESIRDQRNKNNSYNIALENLKINRAKAAKDARDEMGDPLIATQIPIENKPGDVTLGGVGSNIEEIDKAILQETNKYINIIKLDLTPEQKKEVLEEKYAAWKMDPRVLKTDGTLTPDIKKYIQVRAQLENQKHTQQMLFQGAKDASAPLTAALDENMAKLPGMVFRNNKTHTLERLTAKDIADLGLIEYKAKDYTEPTEGTTTAWGGTPGSGGYFTFNAQALAEKTRGTKYERMANIIIARQAGEELTIAEEELFNEYESIKDQTDNLIGNHSKGIVKAQQDYLDEHTSNYFDQSAVIDKEDNKQLYSNAIKLLNQRMASINTLGADDSYENDFNSDNVATMLKDKSTAIIVNKHTMDGGGELIVQNGSTQEKINISASEINSFLPEVGGKHPLNDAMAAIRNNPRNSTNKAIGGVDSPTDAYFTGYDLPGLMHEDAADDFRADIIGSSDNTGDSSSDEFYINFYYNNNGNWIRQSTGSYASIESARRVLGLVNTTTIDDMLKNSQKK